MELLELDDTKYVKRLVREINKAIRKGPVYFAHQQIYRASSTPKNDDANNLISDPSAPSGYAIRIGVWIKLNLHSNDWMEIYPPYGITDCCGCEVCASREMF